jgi:hypothetical protein
MVTLAITAAMGVWIASLVIRYQSLPRIQIINASGQTLNDVVLSGHVFEQTYQTLAPGQNRTFKATVRGESGIIVTFTSPKQGRMTNTVGYIETHGGYRAKIKINDTLDVECKCTMGFP